MRYYDENTMQQIRAAMDQVVTRWPNVESRKMFGCPCYRADGRLFAFLVTGHLVLTKLSDKARTKIAGRFETSPFQAGSKRVASWLQIPCPTVVAFRKLRSFLRCSYEAARTSLNS